MGALRLAKRIVKGRACGRGVLGGGGDPITLVMRRHSISDHISQEEFIDLCKEKILDLVRDEVLLDAERGQTRAWNDGLAVP